MNVALIHTRYRQRGGEDVAVEAQAALLRRSGHHVVEIGFDNHEFAAAGSARAAVATVWNRAAHHRVREALQTSRPDVVHVHNTFPAASPAVFEAARGFPIVHTLHNYRWMCLAATLLRDGQPCEACVGRVPWRGVVHACYGDSRPASAVVALTQQVHRARRTLRHVDRFVALTEFARSRFLAAGFPGDRLAIVPNFSELGAPRQETSEPPFAVYVGRLSNEKGISVMAEAWRQGDLPPLEVIGEGPLRGVLEGVPGVRLLGALPHAAVAARLASAHVLVLPSIWYEGLPLVLIEALAAGVPVIASDIGGLTELVEAGVTGWRVPPGEPALLGRAVRAAFELPTADWSIMSEAARARHATRYAPEAHLASLLSVYQQAIAHAPTR